MTTGVACGGGACTTCVHAQLKAAFASRGGQIAALLGLAAMIASASLIRALKSEEELVVRHEEMQ
jgi:hypothetical protein